MQLLNLSTFAMHLFGSFVSLLYVFLICCIMISNNTIACNLQNKNLRGQHVLNTISSYFSFCSFISVVGHISHVNGLGLIILIKCLNPCCLVFFSGVCFWGSLNCFSCGEEVVLLIVGVLIYNLFLINIIFFAYR